LTKFVQWNECYKIGTPVEVGKPLEKVGALEELSPRRENKGVRKVGVQKEK